MSSVQIVIIKDYKKDGRLILKKGEEYTVGSDTANVLINTKKVAEEKGKEKPKRKTAKK